MNMTPSQEVDRAARWSAKTQWVPWPFNKLVAWFIWWQLSDSAKDGLNSMYEKVAAVHVDRRQNGHDPRAKDYDWK
jgi:hypothetical protein